MVGTTKSTIDAAALQADMARRFKLPGGITRKATTSSSAGSKGLSKKGNNSYVSHSSSSSDFVFHVPIYCSSCRSINSHSAQICIESDYFLTQTS